MMVDDGERARSKCSDDEFEERKAMQGDEEMAVDSVSLDDGVSKWVGVCMCMEPKISSQSVKATRDARPTNAVLCICCALKFEKAAEPREQTSWRRELV